LHAGRPRHGAYTPPYTDNPPIALEAITQNKIFLFTAQQLMTEHLSKHLKPELSEAKSR
jgi:hypothetical protein